MATLNGAPVMPPIHVSRLLELHNMLRDGMKTVSIYRAETATLSGNPLNFNNSVTPTLRQVF